MAEDGLMPRVLRFSEEAPAGAIAMQAALAIALVWLTGLRELLSYLGFTLGLSTAVTVASLFTTARRRQIDTRQLTGYPWVPIIFVTMTLLSAGLAALRNPWEMLAAVLTIASAVLVYFIFGRQHQRLVEQP
jgi:APA family basic amino acid/polyamine antiporter